VIDPHGGELIDLLARAEKREELVKEGEGLPAITLSARQAADLELLAIGGFSPLRGFQGSDDWRRVVDEMPASRADEPTLLRSAHGLRVAAGDAA